MWGLTFIAYKGTLSLCGVSDRKISKLITCNFTIMGMTVKFREAERDIIITHNNKTCFVRVWEQRSEHKQYSLRSITGTVNQDVCYFIWGFLGSDQV